MSLGPSLILALALSVDSLVISTTCGLKSKMSYRRGLLLAATFAVFQGGFPLVGAWGGEAFRALVERFADWIAFGLLLAVGLKNIIDGIRGGEDASTFDVSRFGIICLLAVATSIDAFAVGVGLGLETSMTQILPTVLVISVVTFAASIFGVFLGKQAIPIPDRWAAVLAGLVLIGLGVQALLK